MDEQVEIVEEEKKSPWTRPWFLVSAAFVAGIAATGVWLVATGSDEPAPPVTAAQQSEDQPGASAPAADPAASVCELEPGPQAIPATAPETSWEIVGKKATPSSDVFGPGVVEDDGFRYCFAHSPTGAVFAAVNRYVMSTIPDHVVRGVEDLVADSPQRDQALALVDTPAERAQILDQIGEDAPGQIAGFRVEDYTEESAIVTLVLQYANGGMESLTMQMLWEGGDWRELFPATGVPAFSTITSLAGFTAWSGVA